jgi:hypothetical protein
MIFRISMFLWGAGGRSGVEYLARLYYHKAGEAGFTRLRNMYLERQNFGFAEVTLNSAVRKNIKTKIYFDPKQTNLTICWLHNSHTSWYSQLNLLAIYRTIGAPG